MGRLEIGNSSFYEVKYYIVLNLLTYFYIYYVVIIIIIMSNFSLAYFLCPHGHLMDYA